MSRDDERENKNNKFLFGDNKFQTPEEGNNCLEQQNISHCFSHDNF